MTRSGEDTATHASISVTTPSRTCHIRKGSLEIFPFVVTESVIGGNFTRSGKGAMERTGFFLSARHSTAVFSMSRAVLSQGDPMALAS